MSTPTPPPMNDAVLDDLLQQVHSPDTRIEEFVESLARVPGLGEALVERANSTEFALRHQIARVEHAIAVLGVTRTADTISKYADSTRRQAVATPHFLDKGKGTPATEKKPAEHPARSRTNP